MSDKGRLNYIRKRLEEAKEAQKHHAHELALAKGKIEFLSVWAEELDRVVNAPSTHAEQSKCTGCGGWGYFRLPGNSPVTCKRCTGSGIEPPQAQ